MGEYNFILQRAIYLTSVAHMCAHQNDSSTGGMYLHSKGDECLLPDTFWTHLG